ncbi:sensor histidine kinase [Paenibacillaceae bacterium]|nr:sensor histidine kinase [Paenibacillaceae bacterium]
MSVEKGKGFKDSLRRMFLLHTFVPISLLFVLFLLFVIINARLTLVNQTKEAGKEITTELGQMYLSYRNEITRAAEDEAVIEYAQSRRNGPTVFERFYDFNNRQQVKSIMHIVDTDGTVLATSANYGSDQADHALSAIVQRMSRLGISTLTETNHIRYSHDRYTAYTFAKEIIGASGLAGYLIYQIYEVDLQKLIFVQKNEIAVLVDSHNTVIATTNNIAKGLMNKYSLGSENDYVNINGDKYYSSETALPVAGWRIYTLNASQWTTHMYLSLALFFVLASILLWFLIQYLARIIATRQTRSIDKLIYAVKELQAGNMDSYVYIGTGDEFETLANQYNKMLHRLNALLVKNEELSDLRRVIEVKHLQSQFHPHFIFNVLEMLRYAIVVDNKLAQEIVLTLSRHLRYSISNDGDHVLLENDLNFVNGYMMLQQMRFKNRLTYTADVDQEALKALVPRLMVQPVIENAIKYGYKQKERLSIAVKGYVAQGDLILEVRDDGGGMTDERLREVRAIVLSQDNQAQHIGLHNLHRRLVLMYGGSYGIDIESRFGEGTNVRITIPMRKESSDVQSAAGGG